MQELISGAARHKRHRKNLENGIITRGELTSQDFKFSKLESNKYLDSDEDTDEDVVDIWKFIIIPHDSGFSMMITYVDIFICVFSSYFYGIHGAYEDLEWHSDTLLLILDIYFTFDMGLNFIIDYIPLGKTNRVKDLKKIA
jgi:hypothetical protein